MSRKKKEWLQIGNFLLGHEKNSKGDFVVCKAVSGIWSVRWRNDTLMYGSMLGLMSEKNAHEYLHALLTLMYVATTYPHDMVSLATRNEMPFIQGFAQLIGEQNDYEQSLKPPVSDEEDAKILEEERMMIELEDELKAEASGNEQAD